MTPQFFAVIPAQAGIQKHPWMPAFTGMTGDIPGSPPC